MRTHRDTACVRTLAPSIALALLVLTGPAIARADGAACAPTEHLEPFRFLRQLSLDLRGRIPTEAEYAEVRAAGDVTDAMIAEMVESEESFSTLRRYHRERLWGSLDEIQVVNARRRLVARRTGANVTWSSGTQSTLFRGENVGCVDLEHDRFDAAGHALPLVEGYVGGTVRGRPAPPGAAACALGEPCRLDGWVRVHPYWAPETELLVCAFDAQAVATGLRTGAPACTAATLTDRGCGCGPDLMYCVTDGATGMYPEIRDALVEEPLRIFESVVRARRPYFQALRTDRTLMNGRVAHYYRNLASTVAVAPGVGEIPAIAWSDDEWHEVERSPEHSGVLTTQVFLTRFANPRARANRFYTAFLCEPFEAPAEGLPPATDTCSSDPNLSTRCGCASCHERLEPTAAYFGRWLMGSSFGFMTTTSYPAFDETCATCVGADCTTRCNTYYMTAANTSHHDEHPLLGQLRVSAWLPPSQQAAVDRGPEGLLEREGAMERLSSCAVRTLAERLLHRELDAEELSTWVPALAESFAEGDHDFLDLLETLARDPRYRAVR